jgi:hypothetical protein
MAGPVHADNCWKIPLRVKKCNCDFTTGRHRGAASFQVVVSKATAADSDEATNFSSAVAFDTTLGPLANVTRLKP